MSLRRRGLLLTLMAGAAPAGSAAPACAASYEVGLGISGHLAYEGAEPHEVAGLLADLLRQAAQRSGVSLQLRAYPLARLVRMREGRELPLFGLRLWLPERKQIEPLLVAAPLLWVRAEQAGSSLDELLADPKVIFGRLSTGTVSTWVDARLDSLPAQRVDISREPSQLLRKLAVGRVQAVFSMPLMQRAMDVEDYPWQRLHARNLPEAGTTVGGIEIEPSRVCPADAERLRKALRELRDDGSLYKLLQAHLGAQARPWMVWKPAR